jgi:putative FmdB family regulatory protein
MPIYEYRREDGSTFELMQAFTDDPLTIDPETGQAVTRVLHAPAVHFKGSGFYNTDYGTKRRAREREAEKSSSNGASSDTKSDGASTASKDTTPKKDAKTKASSSPSS